MSDIILVKMDIDCRWGSIEGLFICDEDRLPQLYGKEAYFGEVLGKHSEVIVTFEEAEFQIMSRNQEFIQLIAKELGITACGYNPFDYVDGLADALSEESEAILFPNGKEKVSDFV